MGSRLTGRRGDMVASSALLRERGFAEAKRLCYAGLDSPTLLREVAERLRRVVPFENSTKWEYEAAAPS